MLEMEDNNIQGSGSNPSGKEKGITALEAIKRHLQHSSPRMLRDSILAKIEVVDGSTSGAEEAAT